MFFSRAAQERRERDTFRRNELRRKEKAKAAAMAEELAAKEAENRAKDEEIRRLKQQT